jgi:hypothetical protein
MTNSPDEELMLEMRNGTAESLGVLFDRYHAPLFTTDGGRPGWRGAGPGTPPTTSAHCSM